LKGTIIRRLTNAVDRRPIPPTTTYQFIGGKGGVGKTTCAAALALASARSGQRTLVISTDPAPSLGDAFARPLGSAPRRIPMRRGSLHAVEIDAARALDRWLAHRRDALERIALRGTWLDAEDVARLLRLSLPGIDEMAALLEIAGFARTGKFDTLVVDTAPTGHTLRMLAMPRTLAAIAGVFDHMQAKHRAMVGALRGDWQPDADDVVIAEIDRDANDLSALLRDAGRVRMSWVTLPEPMAVAETLDALAVLAIETIPLHGLIVNRVTPPPRRRCRYCDARRTLERRAIATLTSALPDVPAIAVAARDEEPRGVRALSAIGDELESGQDVQVGAVPRSSGWRSVAPPRHADVIPLLATADTRLLMFGGKGGVGKTTCATAAALELARRTPRRRVLLLSTDPAHSLGDALGSALGDEPKRLEGGPENLRVRELDAARGFRAVRERYATAIDEMFERLSRGSSLDAGFDRVVMRDLIELAPPGIDELAAVIDVTDALVGSGAQDRYDLVVMDTAPSGHALRLLEMPSLVQDWAKALMSILLKYQVIGGIGELGSLLLKLSQGLGRLRALLEDPARTRFVAVTRAAALPRAETARLLRRLSKMRIRVRVVVVNAVGRGTCDRCRRRAVTELREVAALRRAVGGAGSAPQVVLAPGVLPPPHGIVQLERWVRSWYTRIAPAP
jgi:arsenite-transporting ATPase